MQFVERDLKDARLTGIVDFMARRRKRRIALSVNGESACQKCQAEEEAKGELQGVGLIPIMLLAGKP